MIMTMTMSMSIITTTIMSMNMTTIMSIITTTSMRTAHAVDHDHHHHHHADDVFTTWGKETPHKFEKSTIEKAMKAFAETTDYGTIIRSKGMVAMLRWYMDLLRLC